MALVLQHTSNTPLSVHCQSQTAPAVLNRDKTVPLKWRCSFISPVGAPYLPLPWLPRGTLTASLSSAAQGRAG